MWFLLYLYSTVEAGPTSMLIPKGTRLKTIPALFKVNYPLFIEQLLILLPKGCERVQVFSWDHDPFTQGSIRFPLIALLLTICLGTYHALPIMNDYLLTSPIFIQAYSCILLFMFVFFFFKLRRYSYSQLTSAQ